MNQNTELETLRDKLAKAEEELKTLNKELAKSNKRLKQLALKDPHTGLYNYQYFEEVIEPELSRSRRYAHPLSLILFDIDYFKSINDAYSYQFGDLVLKQFAKQIKRMVRQYDIVIRFGGEEFLVISPGNDRNSALGMAKRLLDSIKLYNFGNNQHIIKIKLSGAVASYPEDKVFKGADLVNLTDHILNAAKEDGGDRIYSSLDTGNGKTPFLDMVDKTNDVILLKDKINKLSKKANQSLVESIFAFAKTIKLKDRYTGEHTELTVQYATEMAAALGLSNEETECVRQAAILHDLGKIGISEKILLKKAKLTKREFEEIKKHPQIGVDIIRPIQFLHNLIPLIFYHHERWDGKGYPSGLKNEEIPIGARIITISDIYQALISDRPYRSAFSKEKAMEIIKSEAGTKLDPRLVNVFLKILQQE